jgi:metallo-beta-lactamase family protein
MCEAGRVLHHLSHNIGDPKNTVLLTGYQAENTLGRKLKNGMKSVRIFGVPTEVRAEIQSLDELSGHADAGELIEWMRSAVGSPGKAPMLKRVFLVHGEPGESGPLSKLIESTYGVAATPVAPGQAFDLKTV